MSNDNETTKRRNVSIDFRVNNTITNDPCALCGGRCDPCGLDFMLADSLELVCDNCARRYAPKLCKLVWQQANNLFPEPRIVSVAHFVGVCLLCLKPGTLTYMRGQGFYYCEDDRVYWDQSCDRNFFQQGNEYNKDESDKNEARLYRYIYIEPQVKKAFDAIRDAQCSKDRGPLDAINNADDAGPNTYAAAFARGESAYVGGGQYIDPPVTVEDVTAHLDRLREQRKPLGGDAPF